MRRLANRLDETSRREFLARGAGAFLGLGMFPGLLAGGDPGAATHRRPTARNCIYLYMAGGMSHLDTFDPKPGSDVQGPVEVVASSADGIRVSGYLPAMAARMDRVALVSSMTTTQGAHAQGNYFLHTGYVKRGTIRHPAMGAWVERLSGKRNPTLPANVVIGAGNDHPAAGFMESRYAPVPLGKPEAGLQHSEPPPGIDEDRYRERLELAEAFNREFRERHDHKQVRAYADLYEQALKLMESDDLKAFDIARERDELRDAYGRDQFGQGCLLARRLVEHDVRFVEVNLGGWDSHDDNFEQVEERAAILDRALSTLLDDLELRGLLEETLVVVATEFGRTPKINRNRGRDHHPRCFTCLLAGGGVRGGQRFGASDERGFAVAADRVAVPDFNATIAYALGLPIDEVVHSPTKRPFTVADEGRPITALF